MRWTKVAALAVAGSMSLAACGGGSGSSNSGSGGEGGDSSGNQQPASAAFKPDAKGPAPEVSGSQKGGTLTLNVNSVPENTDPSTQYYQDVAAIMKLTVRRLAEYQTTADGKSVLVPDLATNLGEQSEDGLTWKFTLKKGIKYEDGTEIKASDIAYSVKRSFATEEMPGGPEFQMEYLKGGDKYKGPWKDGEDFEGVEADDEAGTITFHLTKKMETFPYFTAFSMFGPIPKAKDTKTNYQLKWLATGPYKIQSYSKGSSLTLVKNDQWSGDNDPARHQFLDKIQFNFGKDIPTTARSIMADNGSDQTTLSYDGVDVSILQQVMKDKKSQVATGPSPCVSYITMDIPQIDKKVGSPEKGKKVREALAAAYPYDQVRIAGGSTQFDFAPASTIGAPQIPGFEKFELPGLTGKGKGDPEKAKKLLKEAGAENFELSYYYRNDDDTAKKVEGVRKPLLEKAGFKVKAIGVSGTELRKKRREPNQNVNLMQGVNGWCYDWPAGDSIYPPLFKSSNPQNGGVGNVKDKELDKKMAKVAAMPVAEQGKEWSKIDKEILEKWLPGIPTSYSKGSAIFGSKVKNVKIDPNSGMPDLSVIYLEK